VRFSADTTWGRPTSRVRDAIFALHDVLILRGDREMPLDTVSDQELPGLLSQVRELMIGKKR
jgi:hypothetical protein